MAGLLLACVIVLGRVTGIVVRDCYPCLPSTFVCFGVANDRHEKVPVKGLMFNVWPSVVIVAFLCAIHAPTSHAQK